MEIIKRCNCATRGAGERNGLTRCNKGLNRNGCSACPYITSRPAEVVKKVRLQRTGQEILVEGCLNCKTRRFLYLLWSRKAPDKVYLGSCSREPRDRLREHRRDIENNTEEKAVAKHFMDTNSYAEDLVFRHIKKVKSSCRWVLRRFETRLINNLNLIEAGVNRIL